jgi:hypothetical protein
MLIPGEFLSNEVWISCGIVGAAPLSLAVRNSPIIKIVIKI